MIPELDRLMDSALIDEYLARLFAHRAAYWTDKRFTERAVHICWQEVCRRGLESRVRQAISTSKGAAS